MLLRYGALFTCSFWIDFKQHTFATYQKDVFLKYVTSLLNPNNHYHIHYKGNVVKLKGKSIATYFTSKMSTSSLS